MQPPILLLRAGAAPTATLAPELLRCEGFPWFAEAPLAGFAEPPPEVRLLVVAGGDVDASAAERLAAAVHAGASLLSLAPSPPLAQAFGIDLGDTLTDPLLTVDTVDRWEHGDLALLCPGSGACALTGGETLARFGGLGGQGYGAGLVTSRLGRGRAWLYGYDLCRVIADLRHGDGSLDPPDTAGRTWGGPRAYYGFLGLSEKLPHTVPVADVHLDLLRSLVADALRGTGLPRLWHFRDGAPSIFMVRGDGCGESGVDREIEVVERHGARLTFCRPHHSAYSGDLMRAWHARGHGISIEANLNPITQQTVDGVGGRRSLTAAEVNAHHLDAIRAELVAHRDSFHDETGLEMETFMTHSAQWTGLPMARLAEELGWRTLLPFQSMDPRWPAAVPREPYAMPTALPLRYFDAEAGVLDLWHIPYQWIDLIWQTVAARQRDGVTDPTGLAADLGEDGPSYGSRIAAHAEAAARRWHVAQLCSFHPVYVSRQWPVLGSSQQALEIALDGARGAGAHSDNLERWSRFVRGRDAVRLVDWREEDETTSLTLRSDLGVEGLTLLLPEDVTGVALGGGASALVQRLALEGRNQRAVCLDLPAGRDVRLALRRSRAGSPQRTPM